jgi:hypothetical protein
MALLDRYRVDAPTGWADLTHDGYVHGHLLHHLHGAGRNDELRALLLDWSWLATRLRVVGAVGLCPAYDQYSSDDNLRLVGDAMRMSLHALEKDPGQLGACPSNPFRRHFCQGIAPHLAGCYYMLTQIAEFRITRTGS